ncbi:hypothetical protein KAW18_02725 [candidate division WOR-3 bacterium]|nr:hypothetical protein [candidate division WOR-3 bacterium]
MNIILVNIVFFYFLFGLVTATLGFWYAHNELKGQRKLIIVGFFLICLVIWAYIIFVFVVTQWKKRRIKNEHM